MITITIDTDSDAFQDDMYAEVHRILNTSSIVDGVKLRDINGNTVGEVKIS